MTPPFKMKGYTYPGKSPIKREKEEVLKIEPKKAELLPVDLGDDEPLKPSKSYEEVSAEIKAEKKVVSDKDKATKKAARGEFWRDLAGEAGKALLITGIQAGGAALARGKTKPGRKSADTSGFSGIQFGRK